MRDKHPPRCLVAHFTPWQASAAQSSPAVSDREEMMKTGLPGGAGVRYRAALGELGRGAGGYGDGRGAKRSPWAATRSTVWPAVKKRSWGWRQASTSSQVTGVETVGNWRARSE